MRGLSDVRRSGLEDDGESLPDADADCSHPNPAAAPAEGVGEMPNDATARSAEGMADCDRTAIRVDLFWVELRPSRNTRKALRGEGLVEFDNIHIRPGAPGTRESAVGSLDGSDTEDGGFIAGDAATRDSGERLAIERCVLSRDQGE